MKILLTGCAGFIGFHLTKSLLENGHTVVGIDSINDYYDKQLKLARLQQLGITNNEISDSYPAFSFFTLNMVDAPALNRLFDAHQFDAVCNLAAQPGVRYSIDNPQAYVDSNINGFFNLIQAAKQHNIGLFIYASSSSVYGNSADVPFTRQSDTDHPVSFYAATKKTNELLAHTYSHLFGLKTIGVRFFTVYGPWGRPDMAYFSFTKNILQGNPINLYNNGQLRRDFTYIDDIVAGMLRIIEQGADKQGNYKLYNIGNNDPVTLERFVKAIETATGKTAQRNYLPMQPGDVEVTYADVTDLQRDFGFVPATSIEAGMQQFVDWYVDYYVPATVE